MFPRFFVGADADVAAEYFGIRPGGFSAVIFVEGGDGKEGGINTGESTDEIGVFVSAEVDVNANFFIVKFLNFLFDEVEVLG